MSTSHKFGDTYTQKDNLLSEHVFSQILTVSIQNFTINTIITFVMTIRKLYLAVYLFDVSVVYKVITTTKTKHKRKEQRFIFLHIFYILDSCFE